jgi:hypothetical protein
MARARKMDKLKSSGDAARLEGGREVKRALKATGASLDELKKPGQDAAELVRAEAARRAQKERDSGDFIGSLKAKGTRSGGQVEAGGRKAPHFVVREFGGTIGRFRSKKRTFAKDRSPVAPGGRGAEGYFLFPALRENKPEIRELYQKAVEGLVKTHLED